MVSSLLFTTEVLVHWREGFVAASLFHYNLISAQMSPLQKAFPPDPSV